MDFEFVIETPNGKRTRRTDCYVLFFLAKYTTSTSIGGEDTGDVWGSTGEEGGGADLAGLGEAARESFAGVGRRRGSR